MELADEKNVKMLLLQADVMRDVCSYMCFMSGLMACGTMQKSVRSAVLYVSVYTHSHAFQHVVPN